MSEVVTLGEPMAVLYPHEPITLDEAGALDLDIAGAEANLSIGMSRLGHSVSLISRVGIDPFGQRIRTTLGREGVDTTYLIDDDAAQTGIFFREWLPDGARRVYYYRAGSAASRLTPDDLRPEMFAGARIVHLTGITPALSANCAATVVRAIELGKAAGAQISFDPNYRVRLWDFAAARATLRPMIEQTDILLMGHEDAQAVLGDGSDDELLERGAALGPKIVVLKRAERGALALVEGRKIEAQPYPATQVIDPVGAGDGFDAGFLSGWLRGKSIEDSLQLGARIGALSVAALGDYAGYPRE